MRCVPLPGAWGLRFIFNNQTVPPPDHVGLPFPFLVLLEAEVIALLKRGLMWVPQARSRWRVPWLSPLAHTKRPVLLCRGHMARAGL